MSGDCMWFPDTWQEFVQDYQFVDKDEVYTNGNELIQVFRVEQMLERYFEPKRTCRNLREGGKFWCSTCLGRFDDVPKYCPECGAEVVGGSE